MAPAYRYPTDIPDIYGVRNSMAPPIGVAGTAPYNDREYYRIGNIAWSATDSIERARYGTRDLKLDTGKLYICDTSVERYVPVLSPPARNGIV